MCRELCCPAHVTPEVERALRFIGEHLDRPMSVAEVARAARLSEFHLHRVFHTAVGESIGRFITRRRLEIAALRLAYEPDRSITDIALSSGYSSSSNFSKAFSAFFGCSPTRVREPSLDLAPAVGQLTTRYGKGFRPADLYALPIERHPDDIRAEAALWNARVRFVTTAGISFASLASGGGYDFDTLEATWSELITRVRQLGLADGDIDAWGRAHDSPQITAPELCRYEACVPCPIDIPLPPPFVRGALQPGRYAVFSYSGEATGIAAAYRSIYSCWFRESSVAPDDYEPTDHYVSGLPENGMVAMEMWLRVRPRTPGTAG
jgi:AraC family transcriptional regulator